MKTKLKLLKTKLLLYGMLTASTTACVSGCSFKKESISQIQEMQEFKLNRKDSSTYKIISVINSFGRENTYFTKTYQLSDLSKYRDDNTYRKYFTIGDIYRYNSLIYVDVFSGTVVSIKHTHENDVSFSFNTILEEENAYHYISSFLGEKDTYSKEEIKDLIENSDEKKLIK